MKISREKLLPYDGQEIKTKGVCCLNVEFNQVTKFIPFYVIAGGNEPIFGRDFLSTLLPERENRTSWRDP